MRSQPGTKTNNMKMSSNNFVLLSKINDTFILFIGLTKIA